MEDSEELEDGVSAEDRSLDVDGSEEAAVPEDSPACDDCSDSELEPSDGEVACGACAGGWRASVDCDEEPDELDLSLV